MIRRPVGTNRRYADAVDRRMNEKALVTIARGAQLQTLTPTELRLGDVPLTVDPKPRRKVKAWVRFGDVPVRGTRSPRGGHRTRSGSSSTWARPSIGAGCGSAPSTSRRKPGREKCAASA